uniref:RING-type E3 ubiquitin transferase n=1 Tax=Elaeophora elaphi TaxID=1147741 RepID=A0A0R3S419_9BILA
MSSDPDNSNENVVVLEDSDDSSIVSDERSSRRVVLESHSFIGTGSTEDSNEGPEQSHSRASRVIWSSDEEEGDDDNDSVNKKRLKPSHNEADGDEASSCSICFEAYTISGSHRVVCLKCGHLFGQACIERWIRTERAAKCPQCKAKARLPDIRRLYVRAVKALDTTEMEALKEKNNAYKAENDSLRLENQRLRDKLVEEGKSSSYKAEIERLTNENAVLRERIALQEMHENNSQLMTPPAAKMMKGAGFSLLAGPMIALSVEPGSRSLDASGGCFVVTCKVRNDLFMPFGLKLITADHHDTVIPVHIRKPRCCRFSPFNQQIVLSTGEDNTLCVTSFNDHPRVQHRIPLPTSGWCCCWLSEDDVAVGLINGRVLKFNLQNPTSEPLDITCNKGRLPIINIQFCTSQSLLFVTSLKECVLYHHMQRHVLVSDEGSINSFCYNQETNNVMITFAPSQHHETVTHVLYALELDSEHKKLRHIHTYRSLSKKLTRVIRSAFWTTPYGQVAAIYDETNSQLVLYDWTRKCPLVMRRINDMIIDIKEIVASDKQHYQVGCLSETAVYFFEARC